MPIRSGLIVLLATSLLGGAACGDDDDDSAPDAANPGPDALPGVDAAPVTYADLTIDMDGMEPHIENYMEFWIVSADDVLEARHVLDYLPAGTYSFAMPHSVPDSGAKRLDFFSDLGGTQYVYDGTPTDHAWRLSIESTEIAFTHNTNFQDIAAPPITQAGDFAITLNGLATAHNDLQVLEFRVIDLDTTQVVSRYFLGRGIYNQSMELTVGGIIQDGHAYQVDIWADTNNNGSYDAPPTDQSWRITGDGTAAGLDLTFESNETFTDVGF